MENLDVILTNGRVVTEKGIENCDIGIFEGKICALPLVTTKSPTFGNFSFLLKALTKCTPSSPP